MDFEEQQERIIKEQLTRREVEEELKEFRKQYWKEVDSDNMPNDGENKQGWDNWNENE